MLNANARKNFTSCGDAEAEMLLKRVLCEIGEKLSGTGLCVYLGGSYGRGEGGVRQDKENGLLYNDLDFFVFARKKTSGAEALLRNIACQYEHELKVDVDFSRIMDVSDIKNTAGRLMMQELKRGHHLLCGNDMLAEYLPELSAEELPYSEACRLLLNRGMGLLLAGGKIVENSAESDFILRNLSKAVLGAGDAMLIADKKYRWSINERLAAINDAKLDADHKKLYARAVEFKNAPSRQVPDDFRTLWAASRNMFKTCMEHVCGVNCAGIYQSCAERGEKSLKNLLKYCIKSHTLPLTDFKYFTIPPVAVLAKELYFKLNTTPEKVDEQSKLYRQWLIFN